MNTDYIGLPVVDLHRTGENIEQLRMKNGYSVRELADIFGFMTPQAIYKWQRGLSLPTIDNLVVLARLFHVSLDEIIVVEEVRCTSCDTNIIRFAG